MEILISTPVVGQYFRYCVEFQGLLLWHGEKLYRHCQEALDAGLLDVETVLLEFNFFNPSGLFDLKSGVILATNHAHKRWLGSGVGQYFLEVVGDRQLTSQIVPAGRAILGRYEIPLIEASTKDLSRRGAGFCSHQIRKTN
jgi:hypothetical protein